MHLKSILDQSIIITIPRNLGGRGLCSVEDAVHAEKCSLFGYVQMSRDDLIQEVKANTGILHAEKQLMSRRHASLEMCSLYCKTLHGYYIWSWGDIIDRKLNFYWLNN